MSTTLNIADDKTRNYINQFDFFDFNFLFTNKDKHLLFEQNTLKLINNGKVLFIDFNNGEMLNRINPKAKKCTVIKAVEGRSKENLKILDATAGLGRDTFTLASRGHSVIAIEKDIYIFLLLNNALELAKKSSNLKNIADRITLINQDSNKYIQTTDEKFDCIYIDPMFPPRKKSAKVKQSMQILHEIAYNDETSNNQILDNIIKSKKTKKAVVKRPINSTFLADKKPSSQIKGKINRFDIYV